MNAWGGRAKIKSQEGSREGVRVCKADCRHSTCTRRDVKGNDSGSRWASSVVPSLQQNGGRWLGPGQWGPADSDKEFILQIGAIEECQGGR